MYWKTSSKKPPISAVLAALLAVFSSAVAADPLLVQGGQSVGAIGTHLWFLLDDGDSSVEEAVASDDFRRNESANLNLGLRSAPTWVRLRLENTGDASGDWVFSMNFSLFDELEVYAVRGEVIQQVYAFHDAKQRGNAYRRYRTTAFPIQLEQQEALDIYFRFVAPNTSLPITLLTAHDHDEFVYQRINFYTAVLAGLVTLILFTSLPLFLTGLSVFMLYPLGQLFLYAMVAHLEGLTTVFLWPDHPEYGRFLATQMATAFQITLIAFARRFFETRTRAPWLDVVMRLVFYSGILFIAMTFYVMTFAEIDRRLTTIPALVVSLATWLILPALAIYGTIRWDTDYWPIALAWTLFMGLGTGIVMVLLGVVQQPPFGYYFYGFTVTVEALCLWAAMMLRVKRVRDENLSMHLELTGSLAAQIEETLRSKQLAQQKSVALLEASEKGRLLLAAGHDARQVVAALRSYAYGLKDRQDDVGEKIDHLARYLDEVLTTAIEGSYSGGIDDTVVAIEAINIDHLFNTLQMIHQDRANAKLLKFRTRGADAEIASDRVLISRILGNFISNAIKYTEKGGVLLSYRVRRGERVFEVWDTGIGMDEQKVAALVADAQHLRRFHAQEEGLGAGLTIAADLAARIGGRIDIRSVPHRGSVFSLALPMGHRSDRSIAVLSEDSAVRSYSQGDYALVATDPSELRDQDINDGFVFIVDQDFDEPDRGLSIAQEIRSEYPHNALVMLSYDHRMENRSVIAQHCDAILYKPFDRATIDFAVERVTATRAG